ncbi:MAG: efflux RND transporter periplasmic adaptor subunit [Calditrichaeota bacterium]|nr:MAG: efflux RND transporter periplasmic adaptor subunit [Calditrichota bacterium]
MQKLFLALLLAAISIPFWTCSKNGEADTGPKSVEVTRQTITDKALAVGTLDPENEISVKSKVSGVVSKLYADAGDFVNAGDLLLEIKPDPTPMELAEATRSQEIAKITLQSAQRELIRITELRDRKLLSSKEYEDARKLFDESNIRHKMAKEKLAILEKGKVSIGGVNIESVVKAPISGFILEKSIDIGDPVVPLTSYQEGTVLLTMADMASLVFKGSVDEIDVGKLQLGMEAQIDVGAIPGQNDLSGVLKKISLKAQKEDNATVFPIEIKLNPSDKIVLRAGYSANANIIIKRKENVLTLPERVVTFRNDSAFVRIQNGGESEDGEEVFVRTGLSDAINIEIEEGLQEGQKVLEKPVKSID